MNIVLTAVGVALGLFVNIRYKKWLNLHSRTTKSRLRIAGVRSTRESGREKEKPERKVKVNIEEGRKNMNTVKVRDIEIGAGAPKIIVPIVGVTKNDIIEEAKTFHSIPVDVVEWRVDWLRVYSTLHR